MRYILIPILIIFPVISFGQCIQGDGVDDAIAVSSACLPTFIGASAITIEFWYKALERYPADGAHSLFFGGWFGTPIGYVAISDPDGTSYGAADGYLSFTWCGSDVVNAKTALTTNAIFPMGQWVHLAFTRENTGTMQSALIYVNGKNIVKSLGQNFDILDTGAWRGGGTGRNPTLGNPGGNQASVYGRFAELKIWNVMRSTFDIINDMTDTTEKIPGLVLYRKFGIIGDDNMAIKTPNFIQNNIYYGTTMVADAPPVRRCDD